MLPPWISRLILCLTLSLTSCSKVGSLAGQLREAKSEQEELQEKLDKLKGETSAIEKQREALSKTNPTAMLDYRTALPQHTHLQQNSEWLDASNDYLKKEAEKLDSDYRQYRKRFLD